MSIAVTGASGHLGRHAVEQLLAKQQQVIAVARNADKAKDLAAKGAELRVANYDDSAALEKAFAGVDKVLLISGNEFGKRFAQHKAVIDAAKKAGVKHLVYTSAPNALTATFKIAVEHAETERYLLSAGLPFTILRNGWYIENYTEQLPGTVKLGTLYSAAGDGTVSVATRADYAAAAVAVLTGAGHEGKTYELGGEDVTFKELAAKFSKWAGKEIPYVPLPFADFKGALVGAGLPEVFADVLADADVGLSKGELRVTSGDLERLIGRKPTTVDEVLATLPKP